jgi:hypothetical protein
MVPEIFTVGFVHVTDLITIHLGESEKAQHHKICQFQ